MMVIIFLYSGGMETAPSRKQLTHDRILETAARAIRGSGFHGVGVADIMKRAGLTHGGFYAHFPSRDALLAEALEHAGRQSRERMQRAIAAGEAQGASRFRALVESYLSDRHLKAADTGCPVAALVSEMPRQSDEVRQAAAVRVKSLFGLVQEALPKDQPEALAAIVASQMVGALQLARALGDSARGRAHLAAARGFLLQQFDSPRPSGR
jgi:AcrR family transcriptional regulator